MRHVFSCEIDEQLRDYIMNAFEEVEHLFSSVEGFTRGTAYCYICKTVHKVVGTEMTHVDLLACGPSCKDLSAMPEQTLVLLILFIYRCWPHRKF